MIASVSATLKQALLIAAGGIALGAVVIALARRRLITLRYTLGWLGISVIALLFALLAPLVNPLAKVFNMTGTAVFLLAATAVLVAICIQLSITVSGLWERIRELADEHALLEAELEQVRRSAAADAPR